MSNSGKIVRALPIIALFIFLYLPLSVLIIFSFNRAPFPAPWAGGTFDWYRELFASWHLNFDAWKCVNCGKIIANKEKTIEFAKL